MLVQIRWLFLNHFIVWLAAGTLRNLFSERLTNNLHSPMILGVKNGTILNNSRYYRRLQQLGVWWSRFLSILVVVELGLLSPLSCVLHCLIHDWMLASEATSTSFFLCDTPLSVPVDHGEAASIPAKSVWPRAVFESLPPVVAGILVFFVILLLCVRTPSFLPGLSYAPPRPPPRCTPQRFRIF